MIVKYLHHGVLARVQKKMKGKHQQYCLCYQGCIYFKPGQKDNCDIAQKLYQFCVDYSMVTPVWECTIFENGQQTEVVNAD